MTENFYLSRNNLIMHVLPVCALQEQKQYIKWSLRKPVNSKVWDFMTHLIKWINTPTEISSISLDQKLLLGEILYIAEYAIPATWQ